MASCCVLRGTLSKKYPGEGISSNDMHPPHCQLLILLFAPPLCVCFHKGEGGSLPGYPMARSSRWPYIRAQAWNRDKKVRAVCHICGEPIDYFVPPSSTPDSYEPDHLIPVHLRPDLELDLTNIAPSHRRCNRQRGDGTNGTNTIGERSRRW